LGYYRRKNAMNDALLDEIRLAYQAHNLRPLRETFFYHGKRLDYACPLTALAIHRGAVDRADPGLELDQATNPVFDWACKEFGLGWVWGFLDGFDGRPVALDDPAYREGHALGVSAGTLIVPRRSSPREEPTKCP
jgi:hypothetical protein